jgi:Resolvase, N terminal domain
MKRAVPYMRVSTVEQNTTKQALDLRRLAEQRGYKIAAEYTDTISGTRDRRPALDRMLESAHPRRARRGDGLDLRLDGAIRPSFPRGAQHAEPSQHRVRQLPPTASGVLPNLEFRVGLSKPPCRTSKKVPSLIHHKRGVRKSYRFVFDFHGAVSIQASQLSQHMRRLSPHNLGEEGEALQRIAR